MFQEEPCTGADRRELCCSHEARISFCFRSSRRMPLTLFSLRTKRSLRLTIGRTVSSRLRELLKKKFSVYFSAACAGTAQSSTAWPPLPVSRNFFNSLLTPCFVQLFSSNSSVNLFAVHPFKYKLFFKILSSSLNIMFIVDEHCSNVYADEFQMPQIDHQSK